MPTGLIDNENITVDDITLLEAIENADLVLNDLARVAGLIRQTPRSTTADNTFKPEAKEHEELRYHLSLLVACQASEVECRRRKYWKGKDPSVVETNSGKEEDHLAHVEEETIDFLCNDVNLTEVQLRLVEANLRRSHRFAYSRKHASESEGLSHQPEVFANRDVRRETKSGTDEPFTNKSMLSDLMTDGSGKGNRLRNRHEAGTFTETVESDVDTETIKDTLEFTARSEQAVTDISTTGLSIRYPKPPHKEGATLFTCPCCCVSLPIIFSQPRRWRYFRLSFR